MGFARQFERTASPIRTVETIDLCLRLSGQSPLRVQKKAVTWLYGFEVDPTLRHALMGRKSADFGLAGSRSAAPMMA